MDCLIIGGGPAGLTAAIYLGRFRRAVTLIDSGASRAAWIPVSHNIPGFVDGISGQDLLRQLHDQARAYGADLRSGTVTALTRSANFGFTAAIDGNSVAVQRVLLATGGLDIEPDLPGIRNAVARGLVRYCPICDAYEVIGRKVALIAFGKCRVREALMLRAYTDDVTVLSLGQTMALTDAERRELVEAGIAILETPVASLRVENGQIAAWQMQDGAEHRFDTIYSALGTDLRSNLAVDLGAQVDEDGALLVDRHQQTSVPGLYAAGDVVAGLSQVAVAAGQAAIAATHINASLPFAKAGLPQQAYCTPAAPSPPGRQGPRRVS